MHLGLIYCYLSSFSNSYSNDLINPPDKLSLVTFPKQKLQILVLCASQQMSLAELFLQSLQLFKKSCCTVSKISIDLKYVMYYSCFISFYSVFWRMIFHPWPVWPTRWSKTDLALIQPLPTQNPFKTLTWTRWLWNEVGYDAHKPLQIHWMTEVCFLSFFGDTLAAAPPTAVQLLLSYLRSTSASLAALQNPKWNSIPTSLTLLQLSSISSGYLTCSVEPWSPALFLCRVLSYLLLGFEWVYTAHLLALSNMSAKREAVEATFFFLDIWPTEVLKLITRNPQIPCWGHRFILNYPAAVLKYRLKKSNGKLRTIIM